MTKSLNICGHAVDGPALVFPGVGVRLTGREPEFFSRHRAELKPLFDRASEYRGIDLESRLLQGGIDELPDGSRQFFTYAFSAGAADVVTRALGVTPIAAGGYSFGIYAALYATRAMTFEDGLTVIDNAYHIVEGASRKRDLGMGIVVGLERTELDSLIDAKGLDSVCRTNTNHDLCHVFSGTSGEIRRFLRSAKEAGAFKSEPLMVDVPYHHPRLLESAPNELAPVLRRIRWAPPDFPIVSSIDGGDLRESEEITRFLARHLATPISWHKVVERMNGMGVRTLFECGPGISLSQNGRFLPYDMTYLNVKKARGCP